MLPALLMVLAATPPGEALESWASDLRLREVPPPDGETPVVVVSLDEAALDAVGPWPWPRSRMAEWLARLFGNFRPAAVALDMVFPPGAPAAEDSALAERLAGDGTVIAGQLLLAEAGVKGRPLLMPRFDARLPADLPGTLGNAAPIAASLAAAGHINATVDGDGMLRRISPVLCTPDGCSLALGLALGVQLIAPTSWRLEEGRLWQAPWRLVPAAAPHLAVPLDEQLHATLPWGGVPHYHHVSAARVWDGSVPPALLENALVIVGGTALGLGDRIATPIAPVMAGMEAHAHFLSAWLEGRLPYRPRLWIFLIPSFLFLQGFALLLVARHARGSGPLIVAALSLALAWLAGNGFAWSHGWDLPILAAAGYPAVALALLWLFRTLARHQTLLAKFASYLPSPLVPYLTGGSTPPLREMAWSTVMYADLVGYTQASRHLDAEALARWGNAGVDMVVEVIERQGGHIDNVAGDGLLAYWNEGSPEMQADLALAAARAIRRSIPGINARHRAAGLPSLDIGIGLHAGPLIAGSFGGARKRYTVLGEAANLAHRIERMTRTLPFRLLFSGAVARAAGAFTPVPVGTFSPVDPDQPVELFTLDS